MHVPSDRRVRSRSHPLRVAAQEAMPKGLLPVDRLEVVDAGTVPSKGVSWPHPYRVVLRVQGGAGSAAPGDTDGDVERTFYLCSEEPLTDWLLWLKVCQSECSPGEG